MRPRRRDLRTSLLCVLLLAAFTGAAAARVDTGSMVYPAYIGVSLVLGAISWLTLVWMLYAWRTPGSLAAGRLARDDLAPRHTFSLIVPARHEEAVLETTLSRLVTSEHPDYEVLVVVGADDAATREVAERVADRHPDVVKVVVDDSWPKNKPKALNAALPLCTGSITGVFDAEDEVHPALLRRIDQCFQRTDADVVQAGVQLMNFRSSWLTVRNVLEYYFWFRSRLHFQARQGFIPLGGNTLFIRSEILQAVAGWDPECLAEDCELGVRLSALGARTVVVYEPELVTREECPPTLVAFARQRTRWNQGYLQTLSRGYWRRLPVAQRILGGYTLSLPYLLAIAWLMIPISIFTAVAVKAPVPIALASFIPALPMFAILAAEVAALGDFCRVYGERARVRDYLRLVISLPVYQAVLAFAAARAVVREARGARGWEKTAHFGLHLAQRADAASARNAGWLRTPTTAQPAVATVGDAGAVVMESALTTPAPAPDRVADRTSMPRRGMGNGRLGGVSPDLDQLFGVVGSEPLWVRMNALAGGDGAASVALPGPRTVVPAGARGGWLTDARALVRRAVTARADLAVLLVLLVPIATVQALNMLHWPEALFDEGTYIGNAWAVEHGALAPYTYGYGHPPLGWLLIFFWTWTRGLLGSGAYSIDEGRHLMLAITVVSAALLYTLARRIGMGRVFAGGAVLMFGLSPLAVSFHRAVLLDNPAIAWALAAFVLAATPRRRLWAFAGSGACFAASVLSKETILVLLPALVLAATLNADHRTRRYCVTLFAAFFAVIGLAYPLYATLKGELLPGPGHVSLIGEMIVQLVTREGTGSVLDSHSAAYATVGSWLKLDPWLVGAAVVLSPVALIRRSTRAVALAYVIQVLMVLRPGYLPGMYVIALLPFAALVVAGSMEWIWCHRPRSLHAPVRAWLAAVAIVALAATLAFVVAPAWRVGDGTATTLRRDIASRTAKQWVLTHISDHHRVIVDDEFWVYLIEHGYDATPVRGGFFSRTVVSYWPLDYDPAVRKRFRRSWRDFEYIISTPPMRATTDRTPQTAQALANSRVLVSFGDGPHLIQVRKIDRGHRPG